jgi:hypothetical protein
MPRNDAHSPDFNLILRRQNVFDGEEYQLGFRFSLRALLATIGLLCFVLGGVAYLYHRAQRAENALRELGSFCLRKGGVLNQDLVDGDVLIKITNSSLSADELKWMMHQLRYTISGETGGQCDVHLDFSGTTVPDGLFDYFDDQIVGLSLAGLPIGDDQLRRAAERCPCLHHLNLDGSRVTDESIETLIRFPLRSLSVRSTRVSAKGLRNLERCPNLYELFVSLDEREREDLRGVLKGCDISP